MQGSLLCLYVHENQRCHGRPFWEWLLEQASRMGIRGGSALRAMAGFGRHHHLQEQNFFELAGSLAIEVEFIVSDAEAEQLLALVEHEKLRVFYTRVSARFGVLNPDALDSPDAAAGDASAPG